MVIINHRINMKTLAALERVYSTQFELYEHILCRGALIDDATDAVMRRTLGELADVSDKILAHIHLNTRHNSMLAYVRTALASVQNSLLVLNRLLQLVEEYDAGLSLNSSDELSAYLKKLEAAIVEANKAVDVLNVRLTEGF